MGELAILILVGSIAYRGASSLAYSVSHGELLRVPIAFSRPPGRTIVQLYVIAGLPLAFLNGLLLHLSWMEGLAVGVGTWAGMLLCNVVLRFNPAVQFLLPVHFAQLVTAAVTARGDACS
jgi:hypothetical protein